MEEAGEDTHIWSQSLPSKTGAGPKRSRPKEQKATIPASSFPRGAEPTSSKQLLTSDVTTGADLTHEDQNLKQLKHLVLGIGRAGETLTDE